MREAPSPKDFFSKNNKNRNKITLFDNQYEALNQSDALVLMTEWKSFRQLNFKTLSKSMRQRIIFDGRNLYDPEEVIEYGFEYHGVGREIRDKKILTI